MPGKGLDHLSGQGGGGSLDISDASPVAPATTTRRWASGMLEVLAQWQLLAQRVETQAIYKGAADMLRRSDRSLQHAPVQCLHM